jgi:uncharacterized membrane protein
MVVFIVIVLVIEWVKEKIHETDSEQQTTLNAPSVTMDDFRVGHMTDDAFDARCLASRHNQLSSFYHWFSISVFLSTRWH